MINIEEEFKTKFCNYGSHFFIWKPETSPQKVLEWIKAIQVQARVSPMLADKKEHRCRECNRTINEGEASVFGVCDNCWDFAMQTERRFKKQ